MICDYDTHQRNDQLFPEYSLDPAIRMWSALMWTPNVDNDTLPGETEGALAKRLPRWIARRFLNLMKPSIPIILIMMGGLLATGCATKKYVKQQVDPVSGKLDQVASKTDQQGQSLDQTKQSLDKTRSTLEEDETKLSATNERAVSADNRAGEALGRADDASKKADRANQGLDDLKNSVANTIANLDAYKQVAETTVNFKFNSDKLDSEAKMAIDQMVANQTQYKRFFIAVEGFTDKVGSAEYNNALSRRRADAVVEYLVAQHDIPIYRVHMVGLGEQKPVEDARNRAANAKNRRVEVTLYSADQNLALNTPNDAQPGNSPAGSGPSNTQ
jgi:OOP family OmpA-OmpF porin